MSNNRATTLYTNNNQVIFAYNNYQTKCSRYRLRLMRQHNLENIFKKGNVYYIQSLFFRKNEQPLMIPLFRHPHDTWIKRNGLFKTHEGQVITVSHGQGIDNVLVKLAPNVLAFAQCEKFDESQKTVQFLPYKYNRKTKRIYGCLVYNFSKE